MNIKLKKRRGDEEAALQEATAALGEALLRTKDENVSVDEISKFDDISSAISEGEKVLSSIRTEEKRKAELKKSADAAESDFARAQSALDEALLQAGDAIFSCSDEDIANFSDDALAERNSFLQKKSELEGEISAISAGPKGDGILGRIAANLKVSRAKKSLLDLERNFSKFKAETARSLCERGAFADEKFSSLAKLAQKCAELSEVRDNALSKKESCSEELRRCEKTLKKLFDKKLKFVRVRSVSKEISQKSGARREVFISCGNSYISLFLDSECNEKADFSENPHKNEILRIKSLKKKVLALDFQKKIAEFEREIENSAKKTAELQKSIAENLQKISELQEKNAVASEKQENMKRSAEVLQSQVEELKGKLDALGEGE